MEFLELLSMENKLDTGVIVNTISNS